LPFQFPLFFPSPFKIDETRRSEKTVSDASAVKCRLGESVTDFHFLFVLNSLALD
jgi:hypothetical protein